MELAVEQWLDRVILIKDGRTVAELSPEQSRQLRSMLWDAEMDLMDPDGRLWKAPDHGGSRWVLAGEMDAIQGGE